MTRTVPGSGATIEPVFNSVFGVRDVIVTNPGQDYDPTDPPRLSIGNCGTPIRDAVLRANIGQNGDLLSVDVVDPGEGYDPLRLAVTSTDSGVTEANAKIVLKDDGLGGIQTVQVTQPGDGYFDADAEIKGGGGSGAELVPITGGVTGLAIEGKGRNYDLNDITLVISGGGGDGASGVAEVNQFGSVTGINISNPGEFFETPPIIQLIGGGGSGATAEAKINLGAITEINILNPGGSYVAPPQVIFTRDTNLIRTQRNRTSLESDLYNVTALLRNATSSDTVLYVQTTDAYPGSGKFQIGTEIVRYTGKSTISFTGCTRGLNFRYDQRIVLDALADQGGLSGYNFTVSDRIRRVEEDKTNKVAVVYDWNKVTKELFLIFEVDELAFIDGGRSNEKTAVIQFIAGVASSTETGEAPHVLIEQQNSNIVLFTSPLGLLENFKFEDDDELEGDGDGIPDLVNTDTEYADEISLDGGIASSLYGIEETVGGQNTTLFQQGDELYDSSLVPLVSTVSVAGALGDGLDHSATSKVVAKSWNNVNYVVGETVTGGSTGVTAKVVSFNNAYATGYVEITLKDLTNNGNTYQFTTSDTLTGGTSGATSAFWTEEFTNLIRNEPE